MKGVQLEGLQRYRWGEFMAANFRVVRTKALHVVVDRLELDC